MKIFLIRHASPDWKRRDIPYDIHPGPTLTPKGEKEAAALAVFLKSEGVRRLYTSPFARAARTAGIVSAAAGIPALEEPSLAEWRGVDEPETGVRQRMKTMFDRAAVESAKLGPIGLVSHGGPIAVLLEELGIDQNELAEYRTKFDTTNPLPPAGVWKAEQASGENRWNLELVFTPAAISTGSPGSEE
jgi:broad specificity phosphatase PhoE